jgi:glycine betaine/proline transport system substrate-binding protein
LRYFAPETCGERRGSLANGKGGRFMRATLLPALFFLLVVGTLLTAGCGGGGGDGGKTLDIADIGWTENTAILGLTKVLLEEELGYEEAITHKSELDSVFEGVAEGDLDAFQDVWLPNLAGPTRSLV